MVLTQKHTSINSVLDRKKPKGDKAGKYMAEEHMLSVEKSIWRAEGPHFCGFFSKVKIITNEFTCT